MILHRLVSVRWSAGFLLLALAPLVSSRALAETPVPVAAPATAAGATPRPARIEEVVVRAHPLPADSLAQSYRVMQGEELARNLDTTLGAVVARLPGVSTTFFGQAVGRPVIHGLGGTRVRVMEDHIPALDASVLSDDHAVTIEPFLADSIDVLKGPASLIYGSGAIGGVVDVHAGRVPTVIPDQRLSGKMEARFDDVADQRTGSARFDGGLGALAWHADLFRRQLDDYDIPGMAESGVLRRLEAAEAGDAQGEEPGVSDTLPNSDLEADGGAFGLSWVGDRGHLGVARSSYAAEYGLPGGAHAHGSEPDPLLPGDPAAEPATDAVRLDLDQDRWDASAGLVDPIPGFTDIALRFARNDYEHAELEGGGIGSRYEVSAWEGRIEAKHAPIADWTGVIGVQAGQEDFAAIGDEVFAPGAVTDTAAVFIVESREFRAFTLQLGARLEDVGIDADGFDAVQFSPFGLSAGVVIALGSAWELGIAADLSSRAPVAAELFSSGPHLSTQSWEIGDSRLDEEQARNLAATLRYAGERIEASATAYATRFDDFIYQAASDEVIDGLPVRQWAQAQADFVGLDLESRVRLVPDAPVTVDLRLLADVVDATLEASTTDRVPRLPPARVGAGVELRWRTLTANVDWLHVLPVDATAPFETETRGYDDLRLELTLDIELGQSMATVFLQGRNLTDDEQRNHVSLLKDYAPLPGRALLAGVRWAF